MESVTNSPITDTSAYAIPGADADFFEGTSGLQGEILADTGAVVDTIGAATSDAINQIMTATPETEANVGSAIAAVLDEVSSQLSQVDMADPVAVEAIKACLMGIMNLASNPELPGAPEIGFLYGIGDTAMAALTVAEDDPVSGGEAFSQVLMVFESTASSFATMQGGQADLTTITGESLTTLSEVYYEILGMVDSGETASLDDDSQTSLDTLSGDLAGLEGEEVSTDDLIAEDDPMAEVNEMLEDLGVSGTDDEATEPDTTGVDDTVTEETVEAGAEASSGGLSTDPSAGSEDASADNQAALESRFIALYERLMEKQISFKERVESFKTDNQNAGKG